MEKKSSRIKPFSMILALASLAVSGTLIYLLYKSQYLDKKILLYVTIALGAVNLICLLIAFLAKHKWLQCILSILLLLVSGAGLFTNSVVDKALDYAGKVFTEIPETTTQSIYLINHTYYMIIDEVDGKTVNTAMLPEYKTCDIEPFMKGLEDRNVTLNISIYQNLRKILAGWHAPRNAAEHDVMSLILPDQSVELQGEIWSTEVFLSNARVKYQYDQEISTQIRHEEKPDIRTQPYTILIGGNDARGLKSDDDFLNRSDTNFLLTVDPVNRKVLFTVLPYDLLINLDGDAEKTDRLTDASFYGVGPWQKAVEDLLGIKVDYYLRFNYSDIADIIDEYGGITVYNAGFFPAMRDVKTEDGWINPAYTYAQGGNELDGSKTLVFVRELDHLKDNRYETRWQNFREVYTGLLRKLNEAFSEIKKPVNGLNDVKDIYDDREEEISVITRLIDCLEGAIATDLDTRALMNFALSEIMHASEWKITTQHPTAEYELHPIYSAEYYEMNAGVINSEELQMARNKIKELHGN